MVGNVWILGGYQSDFARNLTREGRDFADLTREVVDHTLVESMIDAAEIDVVHVGNAFGEMFARQGHLGAMPATVRDELWDTPATRHEAACASGSVAALAAMADLRAGHYRTALVVGLELEKTVPGDLAALQSLPGVGGYTARAVLAFADSADVAVVDTNVARVLARVGGAPLSARESQVLADQLLPRGRAWEWNQVVMDFGAQVCTARQPKCGECAVSSLCSTRAAFGDEWQSDADPARSSALTSKPQRRFDGSDRQARGRLMRVLAERGVRRHDVASAMQLEDSARADRLLDDLVRDGLVVVDGGWCRLP